MKLTYVWYFEELCMWNTRFLFHILFAVLCWALTFHQMSINFVHQCFYAMQIHHPWIQQTNNIYCCSICKELIFWMEREILFTIWLAFLSHEFIWMVEEMQPYKWCNEYSNCNEQYQWLFAYLFLELQQREGEKDRITTTNSQV